MIVRKCLKKTNSFELKKLMRLYEGFRVQGQIVHTPLLLGRENVMKTTY